MPAPIFLTLAEVVEIHKDQINRYGGQMGLRDIRLLESAIAQPEASFGGEWLHTDIYQMAAAYAFHICMNHPFFDGNKRAALASALVFLELNGKSVRDSHGTLKQVMLKMADGRFGKKEFSEVLENLV